MADVTLLPALDYDPEVHGPARPGLYHEYRGRIEKLGVFYGYRRGQYVALEKAPPKKALSGIEDVRTVPEEELEAEAPVAMPASKPSAELTPEELKAREEAKFGTPAAS